MKQQIRVPLCGTCPHCGSPAARNGTNTNGSPRYRCKDCGKTFSESTGRMAGRPPIGDAPMDKREIQRRWKSKNASSQ